MKKVSIVIGLYNSEKTITSVVNEIRDVLDGWKYEYEIILVDDCSPDGVYEVVKKLAETDNRIKVIRLIQNSGQTNAVIEGYKYATGDYIVEMDDDYQMPAIGIIQMITELERGCYDVVFAKYPNQQEKKYRLLGSLVNNKMTEVMLGRPKGIRVNSFFVMRSFVKDALIKYSNNYPYLYGMIFTITKNVANVDVEHRPRTIGKSNYTFKSLLKLWMNGFLNFSVEPLRVASRIGITITVISFIIAVILVIQRIFGSTQAIGWTSIMITIIFFSGVQLVGIGLLGEYLGRLYISNNGLPRAIVKETINCNVDNEDEKKI